MKQQFISFKILPKSFLYYFLGFVCFTIIGTISHEFGHIAVAKYFGFPTSLQYGSMNFDDTSEEKKQIDVLVSKHKQAILNKQDYPEKNKLLNLIKTTNFRYLLITFGGPIQTMLVGTTGLLYLLIRRTTMATKGVKLADWLFIFFSLFWLRELFNLLVGIFRKLFFGSFNYFGGDEKNLAIYLDLPHGLFAVTFGITGLLISLFIVFKIIPKIYRFTFIIAGFTGGVLGFLFWYKILGPMVLP